MTRASINTYQTRSAFLVMLPYLATIIAIGLIWSWHTNGLGAGEISQYDEFYTYDRSTGFDRNGDWLSVYSLNKPSLKKPPMQYWASALLMKAGLSDILSLRIPSMLFALGTLLATALLARVMIPGKPWVMLPSVVLVASSLEFWRFATSAMLDSGATFFATLGIASMLAAFEKPKYWPYFGLITFLSAMQKSPVPLAFLGVALLVLIITRRWQTVPPNEIWNNRWFRRTLLLTLLLVFAWPLFQYARFNFDGSLNGSLKTEMFDRFAPSLPSRGINDVFILVLGNEPWLRLAGFAGLCILPFSLNRPRLLAATGIVVFFVLSMWAASGSVYSRYSLLILPLLMVGAAGALMTLLRSEWAGLLLALGLCIFAGGPFTKNVDLDTAQNFEKYGIPLADLLLPLGQKLRTDDTLVICAFATQSRIPPGAISVYASQGRKFIYLRKPTRLKKVLARSGYISGPLRGICAQDELKKIAPDLIDLNFEPIDATNYVYWSSTGSSVPIK